MEEYRKELMERYGDRLMEKYERSRHRSVTEDEVAEEKLQEMKNVEGEDKMEASDLAHPEKEKKWDISLIMGIVAVIGLVVLFLTGGR